MKADSVNRWLTLVANFGVLIGIILLLVDLDQNATMMRAQTRHEITSGLVDLLRDVASNDQLAGVIRRAESGEDLSPDELLQYRIRSHAMFRYWEDVHYQYRVGLYDEIEFATQRFAWKSYQPEAFVDVWCSNRTQYSPKFVQEVDNLFDLSRCGTSQGLLDTSEL